MYPHYIIISTLYLINIDEILQVQLLQIGHLPTAVGQKMMEGLPGISKAVNTEGVLCQTKVGVVFRQCPPFTLINFYCLSVSSQTMDTL